ncbi:hypothetical protein [Bradyrhizobium sp. USDA 4502]
MLVNDDLERCWRLWLRLSHSDRIRFGARTRKVRGKERLAMKERAALEAKQVTQMRDLSLTEADLAGAVGSIAARRP